MEKSIRERYNSITIWIITGVLVCLTGLLIFFFLSYSRTLSQTENVESFERYYVMITDDTDSSFSDSIYKAAFQAGKEKNAYVEMISSNLSQEYSVNELMEIAIASKVDGIIIAANDSKEMTELINKAAKENIPVVTLFSDNASSERLSFVGIGNYNLGKEYGKLVTRMANEKYFSGSRIRVTILVDANNEDSSQNVVAAAIQEEIEKENQENYGRHKQIDASIYAVDAQNSFSVEESVREIFVEGKSILPHIVVCLTEKDTNSMYQAVVDYNQVGLVNLLGYYDSNAIIKGIERNVIYATVTVDTKEMGQYCIDALTEYYELGNTSQYFTADISVIDKDNVKKYEEDKAVEN